MDDPLFTSSDMDSHQGYKKMGSISLDYVNGFMFRVPKYKFL